VALLLVGAHHTSRRGSGEWLGENIIPEQEPVDQARHGNGALALQIDEAEQSSMRYGEKDDFAVRRKNASDARERLLRKFAMAPQQDDPEVIARNAGRRALSMAREERRAERDRLLREERERELVEAAAHREAAEAQARAEADALRAAEQSRLSQAVADEAVRKAERDRRYAARKARAR
jgi:hypothetical protein